MRARKVTLIAVLGLLLSGCDLRSLVTDVLTAIGMAPEKTVRISGETYFKLDKRESGDGARSENGYLCVVHDPGCSDLSGSRSEDTFFLARQLPPLAKVVGFTFEPLPPAGMAANHDPGVPTGRFNTILQSGPLDGSQPIKIGWSNTCWGAYGGKKAVYRVTMHVRIKGNLDLGDQAYDPDEQLPAPECRPPEDGPIKECVPGEISNVQIKMIQVSASGDLVYAGTSNTNLNSPCEYRLQSLSAAQVNVPVMPLKRDTETCADAVTRLGPGIKIETTEEDQSAIFGEAHPKHPITLRACAAGGTNPPPFFVLVATFETI